MELTVYGKKKKKTKSTVYNCWTNAVFGAQLEQLHFIGHILFCVIILYIRYVYLSSLLGPFFIYCPCQTPSHLRTSFNYSRFLTPLSIPRCLSVFFKLSRSEISSNMKAQENKIVLISTLVSSLNSQ